MATTSSIRCVASPKAFRIWLLLALLSGVLGALLWVNPSFLHQGPRLWSDLLFWGLLIVAVNLIPVAVEDLYLTFDTPVVLAVAFIYDPSLAAVVVLVATLDLRELRGAMPLSVALFNRVQTALAVFVASVTFHLIASGSPPWWVYLLATVTALCVDYVVNVGCIVVYQLQLGVGLRRATTKLRVGQPALFLGIYLSYGALALVFVELFRQAGAWSVLTLLVPILVARQMLIRGQELERLNQQLTSRERLMEQLLDRSVDERRDERLRIAAELHDNVLQSLIKMWMLGQMLRKEVEPDSAAAADSNELTHVAQDSMTNLRELMKEMRQSPLGRAGLIPTLDSLVRDLRLDWGIRIDLMASADLELPPETQVILYQIAREAIVNALKHAQPTNVVVTIAPNEKDILLRVKDDGVGFEGEAVDTTLHFGLGLMQERARHAGGHLSIHSKIGEGTLVEVSVPKEVQARDPGPRVLDSSNHPVA